MKNKILKFFISFFISINFFIFSVQNQTKCNEHILKKYFLSGMKFSAQKKLQICQHIHQSCCSLSDEIKITRFWKERGQPIILSHVDNSLLIMSRIMKNYDLLGKIDPRIMTLKYLQTSYVPYQYEFCQKEYKKVDDDDFVQFKSKVLQIMMKHLEQNVEGIQKDTLEKVSHETFVVPQVKQLQEELVKNLNQQSKSQLDTQTMQKNMAVKIDWDLDEKKMVCDKKDLFFKKDFVLINQNKANFCYKLLEKMLIFDNKKFAGYLVNVKQGLHLMSQYRGNFYCELCNANSQKYFDIIRSQFIFSNNFCHSLLFRNKAVLRFLHILFIQYVDFIFQVQSCYDTDADSDQFPYANFLVKYKRRIPFIEKCFESLDSTEFMKNCWFLCKMYNFNRVSPFFDGDLELYQRIFFATYSFLRKMNLIQKKMKNKKKYLNLDTVNGLLLEPLNPSTTISTKYYLGKLDREKLLGKLNLNRPLNSQEIKILTKFINKHKVKGGFRIIANAMRKQKKYFKLLRKKMKPYIKSFQQMIKKNKMIAKQKFKKLKKTDPLKKLKKDQEEKIQDNFMPARNLLQKQFSVLNNLKNQKDIQKLQRKAEKPYENLKKFLYKIKFFDSDQGKVILVKNPEQQEKERLLKLSQIIIPQLSKRNLQNKKKIPQRIEMGSEIYIKNYNVVNFDSFEIVFKELGIDLTKNIEFMDFNYDVSDLVSKTFKKDEDITMEVINEYLQLGPKIVNQFNHAINGHIINTFEIKEISDKYLQAQQKLNLETEPLQRSKLNSQIKTILQKSGELEKFKEEKQQNAKIKKIMQDFQAEKQNEKVILNNHVDQKHFDNNFHGIKNMFVELFGS